MKFKQEKAIKNKWTRWIMPKMKEYHMACCDCNLVHTINFGVLKIIKKYKNGNKQVQRMSNEDYQVEFRIFRNNKLTKDLRNHHKTLKKTGLTKLLN